MRAAPWRGVWLPGGGVGSRCRLGAVGWWWRDERFGARPNRLVEGRGVVSFSVSDGDIFFAVSGCGVLFLVSDGSVLFAVSGGGILFEVSDGGVGSV